MEAAVEGPIKRNRQSKSVLGTGTVNHQDLIQRLSTLSATAEKLLNGLNGYRSGDFIHWKRDASEFFKQAQYTGLSPRYGSRLQQRSFGNSQEVLTQSQISEIFERDMNATIADFQRVFADYKQFVEVEDEKKTPESFPKHLNQHGLSRPTLVFYLSLSIGVLMAFWFAIGSLFF